MKDQLSKAQQDYVDTVTEAENATKDRRIAPGLAGCCDECRSAFGIDDPIDFDRLCSDGELVDEGGFSWNECDVCGCSLGGDRYAAHGLDENDSVIHYSICVDCLLYLANGDLPETFS